MCEQRHEVAENAMSEHDLSLLIITCDDVTRVLKAGVRTEPRKETNPKSKGRRV